MRKIIFVLIIIFSFNVMASSSTIVMDTETGRILYQNNAYEKKLIASTTKIMTFVVAYEYARDYLDLEIEAGKEILKMYGTSIYLTLNEKMKLRDLLYGLMLRSGNDAAVVIANFVGGSEEGFVKLMNNKASFLGMNNTIFYNPHGLDENTKNYSTAYDMALLSTYASKIPLYREITKTKYYKVQTNLKSYSWTNRNKLVFTYPNFQTGKTGYTPSAGKTLVTTAKKNDLELTIVTLNNSNHYDVHHNLYEEMFNKYQRTLLVSKKDFNNEKYYIKRDIYYPLAQSEINDIKVKLLVNDKDTSEIVISLKDKEIVHEKVFFYNRKEDYKTETNLWNQIKSFLAKFF